MSVTELATVRRPAVAGAFYPGSPAALEEMVAELFESAARLPGTRRETARLPVGLLTPHAGLVYSGVVAAAAWSQLALAGSEPVVVLLGTNHGAGWLDGIGVWDTGGWRIPSGEVTADPELAADIVRLGPPFGADRAAHEHEHSIEVQLPLLRAVAPTARIVPLAVSAGRGPAALDAGTCLGELLARRRQAGREVVLAISSDMAHYPDAAACEQATHNLEPAIVSLDGTGLASREQELCMSGVPGLVCGMCGIEAAVLGLAALRAMGATTGTVLASATSADAGGSFSRTVGYLAASFD